MRQLGCFVGFRRMTARRQCVLLAGLVLAFMALFRGGAVTLGRSFVMVRGGSVCFFRHDGFLA